MIGCENWGRMRVERIKCKLCCKHFSNGKALGGHMRSHLAPLPQAQDSGRLGDPTEPTRKPSQRRSKRARRLFVADENKGKMAKTDKLCDEEENAAVCLVMLSNDVWGGSERMKESKTFECEICNGVFKCSQALGSHRTVHRKKMIEFDPEKQRNVGVKIEDERVHECPFCGKIFGSGQALGGHKRSHSLFNSNPPNIMIDLNFPAEEGDCEVGTTSGYD